MCRSMWSPSAAGQFSQARAQDQGAPLNLRGLQGQHWGRDRAGMTHHWAQSPDVILMKQLTTVPKRKLTLCRG